MVAHGSIPGKGPGPGPGPGGPPHKPGRLVANFEGELGTGKVRLVIDEALKPNLEITFAKVPEIHADPPSRDIPTITLGLSAHGL